MVIEVKIADLWTVWGLEEVTGLNRVPECLYLYLDGAYIGVCICKIPNYTFMINVI